MNNVEYVITSIPDKIILDKDKIYEFGIIPKNKPLTIEEYDNGITIKLIPIEKLEEKDKEIDRLNNVINDIKKELKGWEKLDLDNLLVVIRNIDNTLKELKEKV